MQSWTNTVHGTAINAKLKDKKKYHFNIFKYYVRLWDVGLFYPNKNTPPNFLQKKTYKKNGSKSCDIIINFIAKSFNYGYHHLR